ncbi:helix-turn-helix domain-containing protein [Actinomadura luteofluorescens]|uniref:helix-turn-helix domain-containing protein n=1 Tax=Actinomadura luteofluorescens TaxID=46163 RepID=UPI003D8CB2FC
MSRALTDADRQRVAQLHAEGKSRNEIARAISRAQSTVSKIARELGLSFDRSRTAEATRVKVVDAKARRAQLKLDLLDDAERLRLRLWEPATVVLSTPKGPARVTLDLPPARDARDIMGAVQAAVRSHVDLDRLDVSDGAENAKSMLGQLGEALQIVVDQAEQTEPPG